MSTGWALSAVLSPQQRHSISFQIRSNVTACLQVLNQPAYYSALADIKTRATLHEGLMQAQTQVRMRCAVLLACGVSTNCDRWRCATAALDDSLHDTQRVSSEGGTHMGCSSFALQFTVNYS